MSRTVQARVRMALRDIRTGRELMAYDERFNGLQHWLGPLTLKLTPGQTHQRLNLGSTIRDYVSGTSVLVLTTDTPGVIYTIGANPVDENAMAPGYLLTGAETVLEQDFVASPSPSHDAAGSWLHNTSTWSDLAGEYYFLFDTLATGQVSHGGVTIKCPVTDDIGVDHNRRSIRYVWGRNNKVNLGGLNDPLEFRQWIKAGALEEGQAHVLRFGSYPYGTTTREEDLADTDGAITDVTYSKPTTDNTAILATRMGPYFNYSGIDSKMQAGQWSATYSTKTEFVAKNDDFGKVPDWSRITWMELYLSNSVGDDLEMGPLAVLYRSQGMRFLDTVAIETLDFNGSEGSLYDRSNIAMTFIGPPNHHAKVQIFLGVA